MKIVGVTGSSGAGKDTVCEILEKYYDAEIIDADKVAKELSNKGNMYLKSIVDCFGKGIVNRSGELNRKKLADIIYSDDTKREELNKLTFIYVVDEVKRRINELSKKKRIVINAPLLYESNLNQVCDYVIAVIADRNTQIARIILRDNITSEEAEAKLNIQKSNEFFVENADYILYNNENMERLEDQIKKIKI